MSVIETVNHTEPATGDTTVGAKPCPDTFPQVAADVLDRLKGRTITLPAMSVRDAIPHMSRHPQSDTTREGWLSAPASYDAKHCRLIMMRRQLIPDLSCRRIISGIVSKWEPIPGYPLLYRLELNVGGQRRIIRLHIRHGMPAGLDMVRDSADHSLPLLECMADKLNPDSDSVKEELSRLLVKGDRSEWLHHPMAWSLATIRYRIVLHGQGERGRLALNQLAKTPAFAPWRSHVENRNIGLPVWETRLTDWDATIQVRVIEGAGTRDDSPYDIPRLAEAFKQVEPPSETLRCKLAGLSDKDRKTDTTETETRGSRHEHDDGPDLDGLRILHIKCWKCEEDIIAWWLPDSQPYPENTPRLEELPEITSEVKRRLHGDYRSLESMCEFDDRWSKATELDIRAFTCPYCHRVQGDSHILDAYHAACLAGDGEASV